MHPLDLLKVKFQVATEKPQGGVGQAIWQSLKDIQARDGWKGLYRGVGSNIAGNASSWGFYFLLYVCACLTVVFSSLMGLAGRVAHCVILRLAPRSYHMLKQRASGGDPNYKLSPGAYLLCSAQASSHAPSLSFGLAD